MKTINNDYDRAAHLWWSEDEGSSASLRYLVNPMRFHYFERVLEQEGGIEYKNKKALDIGCGGGFLSEELAQIGLHVTGVDPSSKSLEIARHHAQEKCLAIEYREAYGEHLPFEDDSFDFVFCCDVLEHVSSLEKVIAEISRVLKEGGMFFYDTVNRTIMSRIIVIFFLQNFRFTAFNASDCHVWEMFIKPKELDALMKKYGISNKDMKGVSPKMNVASNFINLHKATKKFIGYQELARRLKLHESNNLSCSYMGYGIKTVR